MRPHSTLNTVVFYNFVLVFVEMWAPVNFGYDDVVDRAAYLLSFVMYRVVYFCQKIVVLGAVSFIRVNKQIYFV